MAKEEGLTIKVTADMDDDVQALLAGWKQRALDAEAENVVLRSLLRVDMCEFCSKKRKTN